MIIYAETKRQFLEDVDLNRLERKLVDGFTRQTGGVPADRHVWADEYARFSGTLRRAAIDDDVQVHVGLQCLLQSGVSFRVGYKGGYENENISTGVGFVLEQVAVDYAYVPFYSDLGGTHRITFSYAE